MDDDRVLPSWADGPTRDAILEFIDAVVEGPDSVPEAHRIAVFDNDGTLWTEKPMPTQLHYIVQQWRAAAEADPSLAERQPYQAAVSGDLGWLGTAIDKHYDGDDSDVGALVEAIVRITDGLSVEQYASSVAEFYRTAKHLTLQRAYRNAVYQPMMDAITSSQPETVTRLSYRPRWPIAPSVAPAARNARVRPSAALAAAAAPTQVMKASGMNQKPSS